LSAQFFLPTVKARPSVRKISSLLISKEICAIQILRGFENYRQRLVDFSLHRSRRAFCADAKNTVTAYSTMRSQPPSSASPLTCETGWA
jgi:hypothetical protein